VPVPDSTLPSGSWPPFELVPAPELDLVVACPAAEPVAPASSPFDEVGVSPLPGFVPSSPAIVPFPSELPLHPASAVGAISAAKATKAPVASPPRCMIPAENMSAFMTRR
jgi:hypothetical protein